jgi:hypothetical protein
LIFFFDFETKLRSLALNHGDPSREIQARSPLESAQGVRNWCMHERIPTTDHAENAEDQCYLKCKTLDVRPTAIGVVSKPPPPSRMDATPSALGIRRGITLGKLRQLLAAIRKSVELVKNEDRMPLIRHFKLSATLVTAEQEDEDNGAGKVPIIIPPLVFGW